MKRSKLVAPVTLNLFLLMTGCEYSPDIATDEVADADTAGEDILRADGYVVETDAGETQTGLVTDSKQDMNSIDSEDPVDKESQAISSNFSDQASVKQIDAWTAAPDEWNTPLRRSIGALPKMTRRCIKSAPMPLENSSETYQFVDCPGGGNGLLYSFLTEDWQKDRNPNKGGWYVAYNGSATGGDPSYKVNETHNWPPYEHVKHPLNYFNWETHSDGTWRANILTAQWQDRLIYANEPDFDPWQQYVANGIEEHTVVGMEPPPNLDSFNLEARVRLTRTQNPDARVVAKLRWKRPQDGRTYILEYNIWSSDDAGGWCLHDKLCGWSTHHQAHEAYIIMGGPAHGLPELEADPDGTFYRIDWANTIRWLQSTSCAQFEEDGVLGPNPCLPKDVTAPIEGAGTGFMTERHGYGEVGISVAEMDVWVKDPGGTVKVYRTFKGGDHMATRTEGEGNSVTEDTYNFYEIPSAAPPGFASHPIFRCIDGGTFDHFASRDSNCEGQSQEGLLGYLLDVEPADGSHVPLYRCLNETTGDRFTSREENCEGKRTEGLLGFMRLTELDTRGAPPADLPQKLPATVKVHRLYKDHHGGDHMPSKIAGEVGYATEDTYHFYRSAQTAPSGVPNHPVFRCLNEDGYDHFISHDSSCEGRKQEGELGYLLALDPRDGLHAPLFRCLNEGTHDHFTSRDGNCEGHRVEGRMGFMRVSELTEPVAEPEPEPVDPPRPDPGSTVRVHRTHRGGDHMTTRNAGESGYATEDTFHFYEQSAPSGRATRAVYRCFDGAANDHFVSHNSNCEGRNQEGRLGYLLASDPGDGMHVPLFRCLNPAGSDHFTSRDGGCEGQHGEGRLGFMRKSPL